MTIEENYIQKLVNIVAEKIVESFENITIEDVNMYVLGYNKGIDDFVNKLCKYCMTKDNYCTDDECPFFMDGCGCGIINIAERLKDGGE